MNDNFTLRELTEGYRNLFDVACVSENPEELDSALAMIDDAIEQKADGYAVILSEMAGQEEILAKEIERLTKKRRVLQNNQRRMKENLQYVMEATGKRKFKTDYYSFSIQKNPARLVVDDEEAITDDYFIMERSLDKKLLKEVLSTGHEVNGAHLERGESVRIR